MNFRYLLNYTERIGRCLIRKVRDYGFKYRVTYGSVCKQFATIHQARDFANDDYKKNCLVDLSLIRRY